MRQWFLTGQALRVMAWLVTLQVALQLLVAGAVLEGRAIAEDVHAINGVLIELTAIVLALTAILAWRPGQASGRIAVAGGLTSVALLVEAGFGHQRADDLSWASTVHVPLGVASLVLLLWLLLLTRDLGRVPR